MRPRTHRVTRENQLRRDRITAGLLFASAGRQARATWRPAQRASEVVVVTALHQRAAMGHLELFLGHLPIADI